MISNALSNRQVSVTTQRSVFERGVGFPVYGPYRTETQVRQSQIVIPPSIDLFAAQTLGTPATYTSPALSAWHDPSNSANYTLSGSNVVSDTDLSGAGFNETQGTASLGPTISSAAINGLNALSFDGSTQFMESSFNPNVTTPVSTVWVIKTGSIGATRCLMGSNVSNAYEWRIDASGFMQLIANFVGALAKTLSPFQQIQFTCFFGLSKFYRCVQV
jgi:hypothetical protein